MDTFRLSPVSALAALVFAGASLTTLADPIVAPLADGGIHTFQEQQDTTKYQLFNPPTGIRHAGGVASWYYNDANRPAAVTKAAVLNQIQASMAKWSAVCKITFNYKGETTAGFSLQTSTVDGVNVVGWDATTISAPTTGITTDAWDGSNTIVDAEIRLNAAYSATYSPSTNLDATLTHEVGHFIGLQHSDVANQVMSGPPLTSYDGHTSLGSDDIAGCVFLYGAAGGGGGADTQAPSVPTGLSATAVSTTAVNLSWNASTDNVGVTNYKVYVGGSLAGTSTGTSASVSALTPGTTYSFTVSACDAASNCSAQSPAAMATTFSTDTQAPTTPTGLVATPASSTQVNLSWNASTDNVGVTSYKVYVGGSLLGSVSGTSVSVNSLAPSTTYTFNVAACDAAANCSALSAPANATTLSASPPSNCSGPQPPNDQQVLACPAGLTGSIVQSRSYSCVGTTWTPGVFQTISNTCTVAGAPQSYGDLWWAGASENGWGLTITQHGNLLFLAWYIYDTDGSPLWVVLPNGQWDANHTTYTGDLYIPSGSSFANYDSTRFVPGAPVGTASVTFTGTSTGTLSYVVRGVPGTKSITRLPFGRPNAQPITNYSDLWWGGAAENGWGIVLIQQFQNIFGAWYTYDANGRTMWYVLPDGAWNGNTFSGALYRTTGAPVIGVPYNVSALTVVQVGTLSLTFTDPNTATMTYTVDGVTQTKPIVRLPF